MALTRREKWTLTVILLIAFGAGIAVGVAPERIQLLAYRIGGAILMPVVTFRVLITTITYLRSRNFAAGVLFSLLAIMCGVLTFLTLSQILTYFVQ